jgi:hypothetical protein
VEGLAVTAADPEVLLLATGQEWDMSKITGSFILRSTDRGRSFTAYRAPWAIQGNGDQRWSERMAIDPFNARVVYYGTR